MTDQERFAAVDRYIANLLLCEPAREPDRAVGAERADLERSVHLDRRVQRGVARRLLELIVRMCGARGRRRQDSVTIVLTVAVTPSSSSTTTM